jgi:ABC-type multidrug transport system, ATPase component
MAGKVERRPGRIAYLPQNPTALLHRPTLRSEVSLTLERANESESAEVILQELGLLAVAGRYPRDLSCGERQRAALAAVLPGRPDLVLLDEPTRGMDAVARNALVGLVSRLREGGSAVVLATHDAELRAALADRVLRVSGGRVTEAEPQAVTV